MIISMYTVEYDYVHTKSSIMKRAIFFSNENGTPHAADNQIENKIIIIS